jgi:hypothetical protein
MAGAVVAAFPPMGLQRHLRSGGITHAKPAHSGKALVTARLRSSPAPVRSRGRGAAIIYRGEAHRLRAVAHRIVRNCERADDVIHDAFVQILRDARSFGLRRGPARAWIFTIVRNTAFKSRRSADREVAVDNAALFSMLDYEEIAESRSRKLIMPICETVLRR